MKKTFCALTLTAALIFAGSQFANSQPCPVNKPCPVSQPCPTDKPCPTKAKPCPCPCKKEVKPCPTKKPCPCEKMNKKKQEKKLKKTDEKKD